MKWEETFPQLEEFWVLLPRFLAVGSLEYKEVMKTNLRRRVRYVYFVSADDDLRELRALAEELDDALGDEAKGDVCYLDTTPYPYLTTFLRFTNYWLANPRTSAGVGNDKRGYPASDMRVRFCALSGS